MGNVRPTMLPPDALRKLAGLLGQLGHDNAHVRAEAGLAADKLIRAYNMTWADIVQQAPSPAPERQRRTPGASQPPIAGDAYTYQQFIELLESAEDNANGDWEEKFVADVKTRFQRWRLGMRLSEKQREIFERIARAEAA